MGILIVLISHCLRLDTLELISTSTRDSAVQKVGSNVAVVQVWL